MRLKFIFPIGVIGLLFIMVGFKFGEPILSPDSSPAVVLYPSSGKAGFQQEPVDYMVEKTYLPVVFRPPRDHFYAQGIRQGSNYYGVWANITTADPKIREVLFSYASINIISSDGHWIEVGWIKSAGHNCVPKFLWATQPRGTGHFIENPQPIVGYAYGYMIYRVSPGNWKIKILNMSGYVLVDLDVSNPGMDYGVTLQGTGEVHSLNRANDMGISDISSLLWMRQDGIWQPWGSWLPSIVDSPPYWISGIMQDPNVYLRVGGNQGNPVPTNAPCP